jgi:hypothetical protein
MAEWGDATDREVLAQARQLRTEAGQILDGAGLLALAQQVGPAAVIGSVALDLMARPDIDLEIQLAHGVPDGADVGRFFDFGRAVATRFSGLVLHFQNRFLWSKEEVPASPGPALYWSMRLPHASRTWKLDVFGLGPTIFREEQERFDALRRRLAGVDRLAVLRVKHAVCRRPEYGRQIRSVDLYDAVTLGGVRTVDEFDAWWQHRPRRAAPEAGRL